MSTKQLIIVRNDLRSKLRHGKLAAQVAHASMAAFLDGREVLPHSGGHTLELQLDEYRHEWITGAFTKIVLRCDDYSHLMECEQLAIMHNIPNYTINDAGRTVFSEPTVTCMGVGPYDSDVLDGIFCDLKMY
jgi:PTH2 family peptidyl-tRNA hydrolase